MISRTRTHFANRILLVIILVVVTITASFFTYFIFYIRNVLNQQIEAEGVALVDSISQSSELGAITGEPAFLEQVFNIAMDNEQTVFIAVYNRDGKIIHKASRRPMDFSLPLLILQDIGDINKPFMGSLAKLTRGNVDDFYAPIRSETAEALTEEILGTPEEMRAARPTIGLVRLGLSRERIKSVLRQSVIVALIIALVALAIGTVLAIVLSRRITRPLKELEAGTRHIAEGDLDVRLTVESNDEVGTLAHAFNTMVGALRETTISRDYFDGILKAMSDMLIVVDEEGRLKHINDQVLKFLGYTAEELLGKPAEDLFDTEKVDFEGTVWRPLIEAGFLFESESIMKRKNGTTLFVELSGSTLERGSGKMDIIVNAHDITERKQADEDLRQSEEKYRDLFESAHDMIQSVSVEGKFDYVNKRWLDVMGYTPEEVKKLTLMDIIRRDQVPHCMSIYEKVMSGETFERVETIFVTKQGKEIYVECNINGQFKDGKFVSARAIYRDVTERKIAEDKIKEANRELMRLNQVRSEFTSMVSHELRTPLSSIKAGIDIVLKGIDGPVADAQQETLGIAKQNVDRLTKLIGNILDYTKLEAGKMEIAFEKMKMNDLVKEVYNLMRPAVERKDIAFTIKAPDKIIEVVCDPDRMKQVVINLINNALKFTESKGWIQIRLSRTDGEVKVEVEDNGAGIKQEDQSKIFEMFGQAAHKGEWKASGSGLGLTICKQIMELHDGNISVSSIYGKGSTFAITFPTDLPLPG